MRPSIKITPAFVVASLALVVVASGGTAYAAAKIGSAEIKDNSIRGVDVKSNEIRSSDVKNGALRAQDFGPGVLQQGPKGDKGDKGAAGTSRWLLVDANGAIVAQSGGFSINAAYVDLPNTAPEGMASNAQRAAGNVYINANEDLSNNGITVSIALQNQLDQDGGGMAGRTAGPDANAEFSGEISSTICGVTSIVACAPPGANNRNHLVVSPRLSDGQVTTTTTRKRFYVTITGDSSDLAATPDIPAKALAPNPPA